MNQLPPLGKSKDKFTPELRILVASLLSMAVDFAVGEIFWAEATGQSAARQNQPAQVSTATPGNAARQTLQRAGSACKDFRGDCAGCPSDSRLARADHCGGERALSRGIFQSRRGR